MYESLSVRDQRMSGDRGKSKMSFGGYYQIRYLRVCDSVLSGIDEVDGRVSDSGEDPCL